MKKMTIVNFFFAFPKEKGNSTYIVKFNSFLIRSLTNNSVTYFAFRKCPAILKILRLHVLVQQRSSVTVSSLTVSSKTHAPAERRIALARFT